MSAVTAYIALGANLGQPIALIKQALLAMDDLPKCRRIATSSLYRTAPVGLLNQPDFINAVTAVETTLQPLNLLHALLALETRFGRLRSVRNAPRTLDLDLLLYGDTAMNHAELSLPHPRMFQRAFVLAPLCEIAPELIITGHGAIASLLASCRDQIITRLEGNMQ